jgi:hypothetical protein
MDYQKKIKKYRIKIMQFGGESELEKFDNHKAIPIFIGQIEKLLSSSGFGKQFFEDKSISILKNISKLFSMDKLYSELNTKEIEINSLDKTKNLYLLYRLFSDIIAKYPSFNLEKLDDYLIIILNKMNIKIKIKKHCTINEMMTLQEDINNICYPEDLNRVKGSCGYPSFIDEQKIENDNNDKIIELFDYISRLLPENSTIGICVGAVQNPIRDKYNINLNFNLNATYTNIETILDNIKTNLDNIKTNLDNIKTNEKLEKNYYIKNYFPTNQFGSNIKVLDKLLELTNKFKIYFTNKMCGSCFRSFWYLTKNAKQNFEYNVDPEQTLGVQDTPEIRSCFK